MNLRLWFGRLVSRALVSVGFSPYETNRYRDVILMVPVAALLLLAQEPAVVIFEGRPLSPDAVGRAFALAVMAGLVALLSPFWNAVMAAALWFVAGRWTLGALLGGKPEGLVVAVLLGSSGFLLWRRRAGGCDWDVTPPPELLLASTVGRARANAAVLVVCAIVLLPLGTLIVQAVLWSTGLIDRLYPSRLWVLPLVASLFALGLFPLLPRPQNVWLASVAIVNGALWGLLLGVLRLP